MESKNHCWELVLIKLDEKKIKEYLEVFHQDKQVPVKTFKTSPLRLFG